MNLIFDTKNELKNKFPLCADKYEFAMNSTMQKLGTNHKIHYILRTMYEHQERLLGAAHADALLYPVHVVINPDRGKFTQEVEAFLQMFNLRRWQDTGWQPNERLAYQGWVNGYALKVITLQGLVSNIFFLIGAKI